MQSFTSSLAANGVEGAALAGGAAVGGRDLGDDVRHLSGKHHVPGVVGGAAVRVDQHRLHAGEVLDHAQRRLLHHVRDGVGVPERGDSDQYVGLADSLDLVYY